MIPGRHQFRRYLLLLLGGLGLLLASCTDSERFTYATEGDEPNYREGVALLKTGRKQEALAAFLKVIDKRSNDSADSHLEVGLLYLQHINDPLSAIYHFKKFLAQRPNSPQAPLVKQRIDAATRDFARTLPAQPLENQLQRVDLVATLDRLKQENESLKQDLANLRSGRGAEPIPTVQTLGTMEAIAAQPAAAEPVATTVEPQAETAAEEDFNFSVPTGRTRRAASGPMPVVRTQPSTATPAPTPKQQAAPPQTKAATTANPPAQTPPASGRRHVVRPGETLSQISLQYYGNRSRWRDIYAANRATMRSESDLKVGTAIIIP